ncbi:MAG: AraC family transcriptional regulator ligand-binding domain-containing protein [Pseudomonadota bacterium]|nr:AraC family transcriptional regulator ligand-binding domain-containing protein [Pseudomonadota bacterium]
MDPLPLLERHGFAPDHGENEDTLVPLRSVVNLMEDSATATGCQDLGLRLAASHDIRVLGPLAAAMQHSSTVGEALKTAARYLFVQSPALMLSVIESSTLVPGGVELRGDIVLPRLPIQRQLIDQCLGDLHRILQFLGRENYELRAVGLPHTPTAELRRYTQFFGVPVYPDQEHGALHVTPSTLNTSLSEVNKSLRQIALGYLNQHYADPSQSMSHRVRRALNSTLSTTHGSKTAIADLLFLHPRTLQRKLAQEGATFDDLRDEVRQQMALHFLRETRIPLAQLTGLLGLSDQSVLTRSCLRWFGITPSRIRGKKAVNRLRGQADDTAT